MNPFFFGASERALFGAYHPPSSQPARNAGVVICNPFGDEAVKAHRALLQLARMLTAERFHVLRFDYYGTGDSMGDGREVTLAQGIEDIAAAATELKDVSGVNKISYAGLRLGATLALQAASGRRDVGKLALWDPIVNGADYLNKLKRSHEAYAGAEFGTWGPSREAAGMTEAEVMGFPLLDELRQSLQELDLSKVSLKRIKHAAIIASSNLPHYKALQSALEAQKVNVAYEHIPVGINWNADEAMESSLVPKEALQAIVTALT